jgi:hypothetical protein
MDDKTGLERLQICRKSSTIDIEYCRLDRGELSILTAPTARGDDFKFRIARQAPADSGAEVSQAPNDHNPHELLRQVASAAAAEPSVAIARQQPVQRIAPGLWNNARR